MGTYVCQAFNDVGFAESTGKLQVIGKICENLLFSLRGGGPEQADTLKLTIVCLTTYLLTWNFQFFTLLVPSTFINLKSLKIIRNRREQKYQKLRI